MIEKCLIPAFPNDKFNDQVKRSGRKVFRSYAPNFCSGVETVIFYFDTLDEVFDYLKEKYKHDPFDPGIKYTPEITDYIDNAKIVSMKSSRDSFVAGFVYNT